jgi:hypothetical protein
MDEAEVNSIQICVTLISNNPQASFFPRIIVPFALQLAESTHLFRADDSVFQQLDNMHRYLCFDSRMWQNESKYLFDFLCINYDSVCVCVCLMSLHFVVNPIVPVFAGTYWNNTVVD